MDLSWTLRSKPEWQRKAADPEIRGKWRAEAMKQAEDGEKSEAIEDGFLDEKMVRLFTNIPPNFCSYLHLRSTTFSRSWTRTPNSLTPRTYGPAGAFGAGRAVSLSARRGPAEHRPTRHTYVPARGRQATVGPA